MSKPLTRTEETRIRAFYAEADRMTQLTGVVHEVEIEGEYRPDNMKVVVA